MNDSLERVQSGYDRWAAVYDHDENPLQALEGPLVRRAVGDPQGLVTVDLGCGTGRHALWLAEAGAQVTALDFSDGMLEQARAKPGAAQVCFLQHDLHQELPLQGDTADLVVSGLVLEHLSNLTSFFAEIRRVLRPDGRAVVSAMHPAMFLRGSQARFTDPGSGELVQPGSVSHSTSEIVMAALDAGVSLTAMAEHAPDRQFAQKFPRAEKYVDWPMLLVLELAN